MWSSAAWTGFPRPFRAFSTPLTRAYCGWSRGWCGGWGVPTHSLSFALFTALALWLRGPRTALFTFLGLLLTLNMGMWEAFVDTLALVGVAEAFVLLLGLPLGVLSGMSRVAERLTEPLLDFMQTMPAFVYLIPAVVFFSLGVVPGVVATVIFALPPLVRLTSLGLRGVPKDLIEASEAFGATPTQRLFKVQLPSALPSILAGVNQSIMLGLSMVVIAALVGAGGLGAEVLRGVNTLNISQGFEAGARHRDHGNYFGPPHAGARGAQTGVSRLAMFYTNRSLLPNVSSRNLPCAKSLSVSSLLKSSTISFIWVSSSSSCSSNTCCAVLPFFRGWTWR